MSGTVCSGVQNQHMSLNVSFCLIVECFDSVSVAVVSVSVSVAVLVRTCALQTMRSVFVLSTLASGMQAPDDC